MLTISSPQNCLYTTHNNAHEQSKGDASNGPCNGMQISHILLQHLGSVPVMQVGKQTLQNGRQAVVAPSELS